MNTLLTMADLKEANSEYVRRLARYLKLPNADSSPIRILIRDVAIKLRIPKR